MNLLIIQKICRDFGIWNDTKEEKYNLKWLEDKPFTTLFVCGSHESFDQLYNYPVEEWKGGKKNFHLEKKWIMEFRT